MFNALILSILLLSIVHAYEKYSIPSNPVINGTELKDNVQQNCCNYEGLYSWCCSDTDQCCQNTNWQCCPPGSSCCMNSCCSSDSGGCCGGTCCAAGQHCVSLYPGIANSPVICQ